MDASSRIRSRFEELAAGAGQVAVLRDSEGFETVDGGSWQKWATSVLSLLKGVFGAASPHATNFQNICDRWVSHPYPYQLQQAVGVFEAAKEDFEGGYVFSLERTLSGEVLGDFVVLAKRALAEGHKDTAAVLACAALEDALKRYAQAEGLDCDGASMQRVISALKTKGLVSGAQKALLDVMPKIRDWAMHANWDKIRDEDISSVIGFVEQFLLAHF